ncbi:MAG: Rieske 2Fe-2S domain-containing protein [Planctomycetota bacterium]
MAILDHWHPVWEARSLGAKPVRVTLGGESIALFRTEEGKVGALVDCCVHRRARLSLGEVVGERLRCSYHAWSYDLEGNGESPGTPKMHACASSFETAEKYGYLWIRNRQAKSSMPQFDIDGYERVCTREYLIDAPLELVLDNFTEVEHTPTTHANFGYELSKMHEVVTHVEATESTVHVVNTGPQKKTPWIVNHLGGLRTGDQFTDDWTTFFSPVYTVYDQFWNDPKTGEERPDRWRIYVFFNPIDDRTTQLVVFAYLRAGTPGRVAYIRFTRPILAKLVDIEVQCDVRMLESLADKNPSIEGMKLSRFDKVLGLQRDRIEKIYRGSDTNGHPRAPNHPLASNA